MNATKQRFGADDLADLFAGASRVIVAKGQKLVEIDMQSDAADAADLATNTLGPTGNLRAPAARVGKTWLIGFHAQAWGEQLG